MIRCVVRSDACLVPSFKPGFRNRQPFSNMRNGQRISDCPSSTCSKNLRPTIEVGKEEIAPPPAWHKLHNCRGSNCRRRGILCPPVLLKCIYLPQFLHFCRFSSPVNDGTKLERTFIQMSCMSRRRYRAVVPCPLPCLFPYL